MSLSSSWQARASSSSVSLSTACLLDLIEARMEPGCIVALKDGCRGNIMGAPTTSTSRDARARRAIATPAHVVLDIHAIAARMKHGFDLVFGHSSPFEFFVSF